MSIQKVRDYFSQWGMEDRVMELSQSSATVEEAAAALHTEGRRIAKSMSFLVGDHPILVLFAGDARVDNHKFKEQFHKKATMIKASDVERLIGHPVGGVCPFAVNDDVEVFLRERGQVALALFGVQSITHVTSVLARCVSTVLREPGMCGCWQPPGCGHRVRIGG